MSRGAESAPVSFRVKRYIEIAQAQSIMIQKTLSVRYFCNTWGVDNASIFFVGKPLILIILILKGVIIGIALVFLLIQKIPVAIYLMSQRRFNDIRVTNKMEFTDFRSK